MKEGADFYLVRTLGAVASIIISFCLCELLARWLLPSQIPPVAREFPIHIYAEPHPFIMFKGSRDSDKQRIGNLNHAGYRGKFPSREKPQGEYRVFVVGGSTVLNGSPSLPELLEAKLRQRGNSGASVYNFGVMASTARLDLARIVFELLDYSPDLVISYGGGNDIIMNYQGDPRPGYPYNFLIYEHNPLYHLNEESSYPWWALFGMRSHLLRYIFDKEIRAALIPLDELRAQEKWDSSEWSGRIADTYIQDIRKTARILRSLGIQFKVFFQPLVYFKKNLSEEESRWNFPGLSAHAQRSRASIIREATEEDFNERVSFTDLSLFFEQVPEAVFTDGIHLRQEFQDGVAQKIFEAIKN